MDYCEAVLDINCTAPPGMLDGQKTRAVCFACGLAACVSCSRIVEWYDYGKKRVCATCLGNNGKGALVARMAWENAGYKGEPPERLVEMFTS